MKFMSTGYYINGVLVPKFQERSLSTLHQRKRKNSSKKDGESVISNISEEFTVVVVGESIFVHDAVVRKRMWAPKEMHPIVVRTGHI